jgi:two-component system sensor histidine kinase EvgS
MICGTGGVVQGANFRQTPLIVRGDMDYPPYEFMHKGRPDGYNIELLKAVAAVMSIEIDIRLGPWSEVRKELESGRIDLLAGMYYSAERDRNVDFSTPHLIVTHALFVRNSSAVKTLEDVRGKTVIVQENDIMHDIVHDHQLTRTSQIIAVKNPLEALRMLASGQHDCALLSKLQGLYLVDKCHLSNLQAVGPPLYPREYCFAVKEGNAELTAVLNEGLNILQATGEYRKIHDKWFGVYEKNHFTERVLTFAAWILFPVLLLLILAVVWTWILRQQVYRKTQALHKELAIRGQVEKALQKSEKRLSQIIEGNSIATFVIDRQHRVTHWNRACQNLTGIRVEEILGGRELWKAFYEKQRPLLADLIVEKASAQKICSYYERNCRPSSVVEGAYEAEKFFPGFGEHGKWLFFTASPLKDAEGSITGAIETFQDITERKLAEEALQKAHDELEIRVRKRTAALTHANEALKEAKEAAEAATRAKSEFLANVSHEIRTPMSGVLTAAELALEEPHLDKVKHYLRIIDKSGHSLLAIINDILDFSKIEASKMELDAHPFRMESVLDDVRHMFTDKAQAKGVRLSIEMVPDTPGALVGDSLRLQQVLNNLIENAIKFTDKNGEVHVGLEARDTSEKQVTLLFQVHDTGVGISRDHLHTLFKPFTQVDASTTRKHGGTGLGLAICKQLVEMMGGEIRVESEKGKGSMFSFTVVLERQPESRAASPAPAGERSEQDVKATDIEDKAASEKTDTQALEAADVPAGKPYMGGADKDAAVLKALLQEMEAALEIADPRKIKKHLKKMAPYVDDSRYYLLKKQIDEYEYDEALETLRHWY